MTTSRHRPRREQGAAATELVLLTPLLIIMLLFVVALGRLAGAREDVDAAARDAARAASDARSPASAAHDGIAAARAAIHEGESSCRRLTVTIDTADFRPGGTVTAHLSCVVDFSDLTRLRIPGSRTVAATFAAPVDQYRGMQ